MPESTAIIHIESTPGICGGQPRVAGHRITVRQIVTWHDRMGLSADEIAVQYGLSVADVYAALTYYFDHQADVDQMADEADAIVERLKSQVPSKVTTNRAE